VVKESRKVGKYTILKRLGKGGMGTVYKALMPQIDKTVAIKVLQPSEVMEITMGLSQLEEIFLTEARTLASLSHPNLTAVWDFDWSDEGQPFFVMDYYCNNLGMMMGEQFQVEKPSRLISPDKVLHYGVQILQTLDYLHYHNVVHRDIKPHNILVTDRDTIKICDFGMALVDGLSFSGPVNMQIGSPCYTPPEQKKSPHSVDGRADCYSTAVLLYRMLTGTLPGMQSFPLSLIHPVYDSNWDEFFRTGLNWDPALRFQSAREMEKSLKTLSFRNSPIKPRRDLADEAFKTLQVRSKPENLCGTRALSRFGLNSLYRPQAYTQNILESHDLTIYDRVTNLTWQKTGSRYLKTWKEALLYVEHLNSSRFANRDQWRLPTIEELLTLLNEDPLHPDKALLTSNKQWLWSCDQHGNNERWFLNLDMGYAASQDMDCRNFVRCVCSY